MRAVRSTPPGVAVVDVDDPDGPGELISIKSASICASDFMYIQYGSTFTQGHELAGVTEDGRAVAIEAIFGCGACEYCDAGLFNLCATTSTTALGMMVDGGMSDWFRAPARSLVPLPDGLAVEDACLVEPTAVAWHACRLAGVGPETRVAIVGGGAIGLMAVASARAMGAAEVSLEARYPHQVELGERLGATQEVAVSGMGFITDDGNALDRFFPYWIDSMRRIARERRFQMPDRKSYLAQSAPVDDVVGRERVRVDERVDVRDHASHRLPGVSLSDYLRVARRATRA